MAKYMYIWSSCEMKCVTFEWDDDKDLINQQKHGVSFFEAQKAFLDSNRVIAVNVPHSNGEKRFFCFGKVGMGIMTVRYRLRQQNI